MSRYFSGTHPPEGPPSWTALNFFPFGTPPPISYIMVRRVVPMGTSTSPMLLTSPESAKTLVPLLLSVPILAYHFPPFCIIWGMLARVSTLFKIVGFSHRPLCAGNGGRGRGIPRLPSIDLISAVSSPQTNAPAPW